MKNSNNKMMKIFTKKYKKYNNKEVNTVKIKK